MQFKNRIKTEGKMPQRSHPVRQHSITSAHTGLPQEKSSSEYDQTLAIGEALYARLLYYDDQLQLWRQFQELSEEVMTVRINGLALCHQKALKELGFRSQKERICRINLEEMERRRKMLQVRKEWLEKQMSQRREKGQDIRKNSMTDPKSTSVAGQNTTESGFKSKLFSWAGTFAAFLSGSKQNRTEYDEEEEPLNQE